MPFNNNFNRHGGGRQRNGGGRPWNGRGSYGHDRFHHGDRRSDHRNASVEQPLGHTTCTAELTELLGGKGFPNCESPSLRLDKFVTIGGDSKMKLQEIRSFIVQHNKMKSVAETFIPNQEGFEPLVATLRSNLIINQAGGILENAGISIHPYFNVPYLPGSAVKGIARHAAWCDWNEEKEEAKKQSIANRIAEVFGYPTGDARPDKGATRSDPDDYLDDYLAKRGWKDRKASGTAVFMPAFPCDQDGNPTPATLKVDILTPHGRNDWTDPVPNPFPVVAKNTSFKFAVGPIDAFHKDSVPDAMAWLEKGLLKGGLGAKTAAGYGVFSIVGTTVPPAARTYTLRLISPAFLRGVEGDEGTLRESSLRGVLRYWWRILFGSVLGQGDLKKLETKVWGGAGDPPTASQIVIRLMPKSGVSVMPFDKEAVARGLPCSFKQNRTTGIAYASYGMDDMKRNSNGQKVRAQRKVLLPGAEWSLEISFRPVHGADVKALALHADLALKALCTFGGVGSKSRKGFGSLFCGEELAIASGGLEAKLKDAARSFGIEPFKPDEEIVANYSFLSNIHPSSILVELGTDNVWAVVDRIGYSLQSTASSLKHDARKAAIGLPRKIHGPRPDRPLPHQHGRWTPPESLRPAGGTLTKVDRFASPLFVHVAPGANGNLKVNAIAFPSALVRPANISRQVLGFYLKDLQKTLSRTPWE